ncbi:MAG TPA: YihY/virulence factor BrkB family protein [Dermatophilaceae bacterium]|nr:YihY/virulence factor BrkB family protein [Dermatophilaceae bacterium]
MAAEGTSVDKAQEAPDPDDPRKADAPTELDKPSWRYLLTKAVHEFRRDNCPDLAAALTYYSVLALFPGLLAVISLLGIFGHGESTTTAMLDMLKDIAPQETLDLLRGPIDAMVSSQAAGLTFVTGLVGALWTASGYVGAFGRAMNQVYQVDEGRPFWKLRPTQLLLTLVTVMLTALVLVGLVLSGPVAEQIGQAIGLGDTTVTVWNLAKWPIMLGMVVTIVALLYYVTPNVKQPKLRWVSLGAVIAIMIWVVASLVFGFYVANFGSYNKTYGTLAGVIVFLLWLWITNLALLFGAEVDAEMERARQLQAGIEAEESIQLPPRDDSVSQMAAAKHEDKIEQGRRLRLEAQSAQAAQESQDAGSDR